VPQINKNISGSSTARGPYPEPKSSMYILKRARRAKGELIGDILPLQQVRTPVDLTPCFGNVANRRLTKYNSSTYCSEFRLNKYFDKELYLSLSELYFLLPVLKFIPLDRDNWLFTVMFLI
jgi:hypothetical protein